MDVTHTPDNHILSIRTLWSHAARLSAVFGVCARLCLPCTQQAQEQQQEQQQEQMLPLQRSLEVGQS
jgi:hypothetical protein